MTRRSPLFPAAVRPWRIAGLLTAATLTLAFCPSALAQSQSAPVSPNAREAAPETPYHGVVIEEIVARVNDRVISTSDYQRAVDELNQTAKQRNWSDAELDDQKRNLLRDLIDNQLLLSKGKQLGITGDIETERELDELRKQNHLPSMEALEKAAADQGVNFADFKASIQNRVITSQVIRDDVGRRINITQGEEQQYYDTHRDQFTTPESVNVSEILIPTADPDNAAQVTEAQKKADALDADLKSGQDFATLAKANSSGSTAAQGGELGDYKHGQLPQIFESDTFPLKAGEFTTPVRTKQGFVILKVNRHIAAGLQPFAQVQAQVEDALGEKMMQPALRQYLSTLREQASIDLRPGYTDSAATVNETHPNLYFSAYQAPTKKKKKVKQLTRFNTRGRVRTRSNKQLAALPAATPGAAATAATGSTSSSSTATQQAGKREKVRFGQAPRETLPAVAARDQDAGASQANGNGSQGESASTQGANAPANLQYENGESATDEQAQVKREKTRFSQVAETEHKKKVRKAKQEEAAATPAPADRQEASDTQEQAQPLGLEGDTAKARKKPKPTYTGKTRYSDEATKDKTPAAANTPGQGTASEPNQESSPQNAAGTTPPVTTQSTPTGSGDPMGNPTPPPQTPQTPQ